MNKIGSIVGIALISFIISYLLSAAFNKYGIDTTTITSSIFIVISTLGIIAVIGGVLSLKWKPKDN